MSVLVSIESMVNPQIQKKMNNERENDIVHSPLNNNALSDCIVHMCKYKG